MSQSLLSKRGSSLVFAVGCHIYFPIVFFWYRRYPFHELTSENFTSVHRCLIPCQLESSFRWSPVNDTKTHGSVLRKVASGRLAVVLHEFVPEQCPHLRCSCLSSSGWPGRRLRKCAAIWASLPAVAWSSLKATSLEKPKVAWRLFA